MSDRAASPIPGARGALRGASESHARYLWGQK